MLKTLEDLIQFTEKDLLSIPNAGHKTVIEIQNFLKKASHILQWKILKRVLKS